MSTLFLSGKIIMNTLTKLNFFEKNIAKIDKLLVKRSGNSHYKKMLLRPRFKNAVNQLVSLIYIHIYKKSKFFPGDNKFMLSSSHKPVKGNSDVTYLQIYLGLQQLLVKRLSQPHSME